MYVPWMYLGCTLDVPWMQIKLINWNMLLGEIEAVSPRSESVELCSPCCIEINAFTHT